MCYRKLQLFRVPDFKSLFNFTPPSNIFTFVDSQLDATDESAFAASFNLGPFIDEQGTEICMAYLEHKCSAKTCPQLKSHNAIYITDSELNKVGACIEECSLKLAIVEMFGAVFEWRNQKYIAAIFKSLSIEREIFVRHDPMTRKFELIRQQEAKIIRVLTYSGYMEVMTICEEASSKVKPFAEQPIFSKATMRFNSPADPFDLSNLGCVVCNDNPFTQYSRGIHVPFKKSKIKRLNVARGKFDIVGKGLNQKDVHIQLFQQKGLEAAEMLNKLFL